MLFRYLLLYTILSLGSSYVLSAQTTPYTNYMTGDTADVNTIPQSGICLMGGATENDSAMVWFLRRASGGDVIVIRASGADGYNDYLYSDLGVIVNSVQTLVVNSVAGANHPYIAQQISHAEAIWIAGGDQADYINYWRNSPIENAINYAIQTKKAVIGGTSAGMAVLGGTYFAALNGSVTSAEALADPYNVYMTLQHDDFISLPILKNTVCDTHYDDPDRRARHLTFLSRMMSDWQIEQPLGIACEEYTAVCIDTTGIARVFGAYPTENDFAYFIQANCTDPNTPEICIAGQTLTWNRSQAAVKAYKVPGTSLGSNTFDLNDWVSGNGGEWQHWSANNGVFNVIESTSILEITAPDCNDVSIEPTEQSSYNANNLLVSPNPAKTTVAMHLPVVDNAHCKMLSVDVYDMSGKLCHHTFVTPSNNTATIDIACLAVGIYTLHATTTTTPTQTWTAKLVVKR